MGEGRANAYKLQPLLFIKFNSYKSTLRRCYNPYSSFRYL